MSETRSNLFGIGDFSRFTLLSVRMLRHYDQRGLLTPAEVDPYNGYRYYSPSQLRDAARIRVLRDVGCGIEQIAQLLPLFERTDELQAQLAVHAKSLDAAAQQIADQQSLLSTIIDQLKEHTMTIIVQSRDYPALRVLALRRKIPTYDSEGALWMDFSEFMQGSSAPDFSLFGRWGATFFDPDYREEDIDVAIWGEYTGDFEPEGDFQIIEFPAQKVAWATLVGPYEGTAAVCEAIGTWISDNGFTPNGPMFNVNVVSPAQDPNPANWVTEINYPIA